MPPVCINVIFMCKTRLPWGQLLRCPKIPLIHITTHYYILLHTSQSLSRYTCQNHAIIMVNQVWFEAHLRDTSGKGGSVRFAHHLDSDPQKAACGLGWRYGYHPVRLLQWLSQRRPSLQPRPRQRWFKPRGWRRLPDVLCEFLGAGLVPRPVKCNKVFDCRTFVITHYCEFIILLHWLLLCIITISIFTLLILSISHYCIHD